MPKKKIQENEYTITLSDWIVFLESNASTNTSLYILIGTLLIALAITIISFDKIDSSFIIYTAFIIIALSVIIIKLKYSSERIRYYQRLSKKIMEGKIADPKKVLEEYNKFKRDI